mmetsp:Transcript_65901/g.157249  ORF Transcript_65901/g.157249 Transcript_65901/m.157249 type:complete len:224 (-) Transcript_65901:8-679(-)
MEHTPPPTLEASLGFDAFFGQEWQAKQGDAWEDFSQPSSFGDSDAGAAFHQTSIEHTSAGFGNVNGPPAMACTESWGRRMETPGLGQLLLKEHDGSMALWSEQQGHPSEAITIPSPGRGLADTPTRASTPTPARACPSSSVHSGASGEDGDVKTSPSAKPARLMLTPTPGSEWTRSSTGSSEGLTWSSNWGGGGFLPLGMMAHAMMPRRAEDVLAGKRRRKGA